VDGVVAIGVITPAGAAAQHLARQERFALEIGAVETGVADGFLIRRHPPVHRLRHHTGQEPKAAQQHEGARIGRGRPFRRDQRSLRRKDHLEHVADTFVDVNFRGTFRRVGEVAQDRRDPFDQEGAVGIVGRPIDRPGRLRIGAVEVERDLAALLGHLQRQLVQFWIGDAVVFDVIFPGIFAVGDLAQQLVAVDVAAFLQDGLEAGFDLILAETRKQAGHPLRAHQAGLDFAVEIGRQHLRHAGVAPDDGKDGVVAHALAVDFYRRNREAFLEHRGGGSRHRARDPAADIVVMAEGLDIGHDLALMKHRHGAAQIGQMADAAFGEIGVVHQEHVAGPHGMRREIPYHAVRHRRIGSSGQLAAIAIEQSDPKIMRLADHRAARGALDGIFDLGLDRIKRAIDDLQHDRIDHRGLAHRRGRPRMGFVMHVHGVTSRCDFAGRITRMPCGSASTTWPGKTTVVEPNSSMMAGPSTAFPVGSDARS
jgi:hypothetical protein